MPAEEFHSNKRMPSGKHYTCKACMRAAVGRTIQKRLEVVAEFKGQGCVDCGVKYPVHVMDCDHLPKYEKAAEISWLVHHGSMKKLRAELEKCEPVCANCHRVRTWLRQRGAVA